MSTIVAAVLEAPAGQRIALEGVAVEAHLNGLLAEATLTQTYRNLEAVNIEAVYSFPLPLDAVLLELTLELNGQRLSGVVQGRAEASARYEDAVEDGDTAVLLEQAEPGLYTVNLGNLLPGETAVIRVRYAQLLRWQGEALRYHLPTTLAPRYGDPAAAGLAPHQVPEYTLQAQHGFRLALTLSGALAKAPFECPSHPVGVTDEDGRRTLTLAGGRALMDRDFVLVLREPAGGSGEALVSPDGAGYVVLGAFHPAVPAPAEPLPRCIKLVVDCSGSMSGDSIAQARVALGEILELLAPHDHFNLIAFGSGPQLLFPATVAATEANLRRARAFVEGLNADLGGTELGAALEAAYRGGRPAEGLADVLLITDGEVWGGETLAKAARASGHRVFTIGVGSAVSEATVRGLAEATGGACELVSPREDMAERIVRHFRRIDQPGASGVQVDWGEVATRQSPAQIEALYAGDTLHLFGWLAARPAGPVTLRAQLADGRALVQRVTSRDAEGCTPALQATLPRVAAWRRLRELDGEAARALAVQYQLVTEYTSCVLVQTRAAEEQADTIPALRKVPQQLAAGWGGMGAVHITELATCACSPRPDFLEAIQASDSMCEIGSGYDIHDLLDDDPRLGADWVHDWKSPLVARLNARFPATDAVELQISDLQTLELWGMPTDIARRLRALINDEATEVQLVLAVLLILIEGDLHGSTYRHLVRLVRKATKAQAVPDSLVAVVRGVLAG